MTDQHQAITALIEAIEAGDGISIGDVGEVSSLNAREILTVMNAYKGSLDAALSLHEALLPDVGWEVYRTAKYPGMIPGSCPSPYKAIVGWGEQVSGHSETPARAWLLAILRAYASQLPAASNRKGAAE